MSHETSIYLGPYLRIDRKRFDSNCRARFDSVDGITKEALIEPRDMSIGDLSEVFVLAIPNCGLPFDRATHLEDDDSGVLQIEEVDIEYEKSMFYDQYKNEVDLVRKELGDPTKAVICWGYLIWRS